MEVLTPKITKFNGQNKMKISNKGLTLLEILITLAILGVVAISFISLFTTTNLNINFSGEKVDATVEAKSILDEIRSRTTNYPKGEEQKLREIIIEILDSHYKGNYEIFNKDDNNFYKYSNKKIHCCIKEETITEKSVENIESNIESNMYKIKVILFYNNGKKNIELSTYIPIKEDGNGK